MSLFPTPCGADEFYQTVAAVPAEHLPGPGVTEHLGGRPVLLPYAEHRPAGGEVFENLAGKHLCVFRLPPERKYEHVGAQLLGHHLVVWQIPQIHELVAQTARAYRLDDLGVGLAGEPDLKPCGECGALGAFSGKRVPEVQRIAVGGEKGRYARR